MLIRYLVYPGGNDPQEYVSPADSTIIQSTYDFIRANLATTLQKMKPQDLTLNNPERNWCLADANKTYLVYALKGGRIQLDLSAASGTFTARWFNPRTGELSDAGRGSVAAGKTVTFNAPDHSDWVLWLSRDGKSFVMASTGIGYNDAWSTVKGTFSTLQFLSPRRKARKGRSSSTGLPSAVCQPQLGLSVSSRSVLSDLCAFARGFPSLVLPGQDRHNGAAKTSRWDKPRGTRGYPVARNTSSNL